MHELSIAISIVDGALEELRRSGAKGATAIHIRVGRLCGVNPDALLFSYGVAAQETVLARSRLVIELVEVAIYCPHCHMERPALAFPVLVCDACGTLAGRVVHGEELDITAMEVVS